MKKLLIGLAFASLTAFGFSGCKHDHGHHKGHHKEASACEGCAKGKAGESVWCDACSKGFVAGDKVACKGCFAEKTGGEACSACAKK